MGTGFLQRGGWWVLGQGVLLTLVVTGGIAWRNQYESVPATRSGAVLVAIGAIFGLAGALALGRNLTPFPQPSARTRFVQHGIYRLMRHPLYTAVISACLGWSLLMRSWPASLASLALAIFLDRKARVEEQLLVRQFSDYPAYQQRVRRFVPWIY